MANQVSVARGESEVKLVISEEMKHRFKELSDRFEDIIIGVENGTVSGDEYARAADEFNELTIYSGRNSSLLKFSIFVLCKLEVIEKERRRASVRKTKGSYSIPDKVIDGVIRNIIAGERVADACKYAGITSVTLYSRIRDRGYDDIKEFFKEQKRKAMEVNRYE